MMGTPIAEVFLRWGSGERDARTLEDLCYGVFPAAFPCGIVGERDGEQRQVGTQFFPIAEAVAKARAMEEYLQSKVGIVTLSGNVGAATPFIFAGACFAFDVLAPELELLVDAAVR
jgi:hypothetical protein